MKTRDWPFMALRIFRILKGVVLNGNESRTLSVLAGPAVSRDGLEIIPVELKSGQTLHAKEHRSFDQPESFPWAMRHPAA